MSALKLLHACPSQTCCIEQFEYYRCTSCGKDFIVKSGEDLEETAAPETAHVLVQAAYGWLGTPPS